MSSSVWFRFSQTNLSFSLLFVHSKQARKGSQQRITHRVFDQPGTRLSERQRFHHEVITASAICNTNGKETHPPTSSSSSAAATGLLHGYTNHSDKNENNKNKVIINNNCNSFALVDGVIPFGHYLLYHCSFVRIYDKCGWE